MPLSRLEHFLIQTADLAQTRDWYVRVLGMHAGWHPDFKFPVVWLYLGDQPVLHLAEGGANVSENRRTYLGQQSTAVQGSGVVDHVAFHSTGLSEMIAHLKREGVRVHPAHGERPGAVPAFPDGSERREDRTELRQQRSDRAGRGARCESLPAPLWPVKKGSDPIFYFWA